VDNPGSGYSTNPNVVIRDGTIFDPILNHPTALTEASAIATLSIQENRSGYFRFRLSTTPIVTITDPTGSGAAATALLDNGIISAITIKKPGSGYLKLVVSRNLLIHCPDSVFPGPARRLANTSRSLWRKPKCTTALWLTST